MIEILLSLFNFCSSLFFLFLIIILFIFLHYLWDGQACHHLKKLTHMPYCLIKLNIYVDILFTHYSFKDIWWLLEANGLEINYQEINYYTQKPLFFFLTSDKLHILYKFEIPCINNIFFTTVFMSVYLFLVRLRRIGCEPWKQNCK